jgi:peptidyl-prolyl cis-trans isomerase D
MITAFRRLAKSPAAAVIIGLLVVSFAVFGLNDVFRASASRGVVTAGEHTVTPQEFRRIFDQQLDRIRQESGQTVTVQQAVDEGFHRQLADQLAAETALAEWTRRAGVVPADTLVVEELRRQPRFFNPITGAFDQDTYEQTIRQEFGMEPARFEKQIKDGIANSHLAAALQAGFRAPRTMSALYTSFGLETRDASSFVLTPAAAGAVPRPTDAQLQAFLQENAERLRRPEFRQISIVPFTPGQAAGNAPIDEAALRKRYDFKKDALSQAERRTFVQVPARDAAAAQRIVAALRAGQGPDAVARANNVEAVRVEDRPRTAISDPAVAQAAFGLQPNQVSGPVRTAVGVSVIKLLSVTPGREVTFEEARPQLVEEVRREQATERVYQQVERFTAARDGGANIATAAQQVGARLVQLPPLTAEGQAPDGQRIGVPEQVLKIAFALEQGGESDVEEVRAAGPDGQPVAQYFAVRVDRVLPAALPSLQEVRGPLTAAWTQREVARRLQERADQLAARVRRGEPLAAAAASVGAPVRTARNISRQGGSDLSPEVVGRLFQTPKGQPFTARAQTGFVVGRVDEIRPPEPSGQAAILAEQARPQASAAILNDMAAAARLRARTATKASIDETLLYQALGVDPPAAKADAKAKK